jgi:NosR/NirI family nitrous oxide reductase transcriptional regulator
MHYLADIGPKGRPTTPAWNASRATVWLVSVALAAAIALLAAGTPARAASSLEGYLAKEKPATFNPAAKSFGKPHGSPPMAPLLGADGKPVGQIFLNADWVNAIGYSGKPIEILIAIDPKGVITGLKLVHHAEPIVLVGIPESKVRNFIKGYVGKNALELAKATANNNRGIDIVSGATVTIMVIDDSIVHSAVKVARQVSGQTDAKAAAPQRKIDPAQTKKQDWITLLGDGSVRRLRLEVGEINSAYRQAGHPRAVVPAREAEPDDTFIDLYAALVSIPSVGRSLLGDAEYRNLKKRLKPGQQAVLLAGKGLYSFKGSGYVRGGIFDRIQLIQGEINVRFRDKQHKRLADVMAQHAPEFREVALFRIDPKSGFRADLPWRIQLLVAREVAPLEKAFITFDLGYIPPPKYFLPPAEVKAAAPPKTTPAAAGNGKEGTPLWMRLWQRKTVDIAILLAALGILTAIFFFQNWVVLSAKRLDTIRVGFLIFTTFYLGFYAHAQLSVVNVLTFTNSLLTGFKWEYFLTEPMTFILWCSVAGSLPFWGRGPYCGWLCPFGALQELTNRVAKFFKVPQLRLPWGLHERLWPLKYIIFMGILGLSLYSLGLAEQASEIEPFKTAIILHFVREWWYVLFAVALLVIGLFVERFFCRYLCPLGAALALPGRLRMFEWLRRYNECGSPCQTCAKQCMVQAIHPTGQINPNECLYCLHCQQVYYDDHLCPVMVERRQRRERRQARASKPEVIAAAAASNAGGNTKGCGAART